MAKPEPLFFTDVFWFGKHKDKKVSEVIDEDPTYIRWLVENKKGCFDHEVMQAVSKREKGIQWRL